MSSHISDWEPDQNRSGPTGMEKNVRKGKETPRKQGKERLGKENFREGKKKHVREIVRKRREKGKGKAKEGKDTKH